MTVVNLRWRKLKSGVRSYYLDYYFGGKRHREFLKLHLRYHDGDDRELLKIAREAQRAKTRLLTTKDLGLEDSIEGELSFIDHFKQYILDYRGKDFRKLEACLKKFLQFLAQRGHRDIRIRQVDDSLLKSFKNYLTASLQKETVRSYMGVMRKVIRGDHFSPKIKDKATLAKQILNDQEIRQLAQTRCGNDDVKRAFLLATYTGLGLSECKDLTWDHIYDGRINIRRNKTGVELNIPITHQTMKLLGNKDEYEEIFQLPTTNGANKVIRSWIQRAGIDKKISFYCARHSYAVRLLNQGTDLQTLAHLMGHTGQKTLRKYLNHVDQIKRRAIEKLPDL